MHYSSKTQSKLVTAGYFVSVLVIGCIIVLRAPLSSSFWLDEGVSYWVISGSFEQLWSRTLNYQGQSPLYFSLLWMFSKFTAQTEWILRLPSVLASIGTLCVLFLLGRHFTGSVITAFASVLLFVLSDEFLKASFSARPYAFALACSLASIYFFVRFLESEKSQHLFYTGLFAVLAYYFHYLFIVCLFAHLVFYIALPGAACLKRIVRALIYTLILLIPGLFQLIELSRKAKNLSFAPEVTAPNFLSELIPISLLVYLAFPILVTWIVTAKKPEREYLPNRTFFAGVTLWYIFPFLLFAFHSFASPHSLFVVRYFLWALPAVCLLGAILFTAYSSEKALLLNLAILTLFGFARELDRQWQIEDWRGAVRAMEEKNPGAARLLVYSGLIESDIPGLEKQPEGRSYLLSPLSPYLTTAGAVTLPSDLERAAPDAYLRSIFYPIGRKSGLNYIASVKTIHSDKGKEWKVHEKHLSWLKQRGFDSKPIFESAGVVVYSLRRIP